MWRAKVDVDEVAAAGREWREPEVRVVARAQRAVEKVRHHAHVVPVLRKHVDVGGIGAHLLGRLREVDGHAVLVEDLESTQADVKGVAPR